MTTTRLAMGLCMLLAAGPSVAQQIAALDSMLNDSLEVLMTMPVTIATLSPVAVSKAPSVVTLITADDIRATGSTNLMEILQTVPGLYVKTNLFGFKPLITFRGASGANVLLMVNGSPVKDLVWSPSIFWKGMPASQIERIEVIRGPGSALFGSDASAGVINVITKSACRLLDSEAGLRAGSFGSYSAWLQHGTSWNGIDLALTASFDRTDGHDPFIARARGTPAAGNAQYGYQSQDLRLSLARGPWRLLADATRHDDIHIGLTGAAVLDPNTRANDSLTGLALLYDDPEVATGWGVNAELRYREMEYSSGNGFFEGMPGFALLNRMSSFERRLNADLGATYRGLRNHALRFGVGFMEQHLGEFHQALDGVVVPLLAPPKRYTRYFYLQDVWTISPAWELTAGVRHDDYSDFGGTTNPRLALVWQATPQLTAKLLYGEAFRAPSYLELHLTTSANPPNPALKPERSKTLEASLSWLATRDLRLGINLYEFRRKDVIAPEVAAPFQFQNYPEFNTRGIELEGQWQASHHLRLAGNYSVMRNGDVDSPLRDLAIPLQQAYARLDWQFRPKWNWNLQLHWFDRRPLSGDPTDRRREIGKTTLVNTTIRYFHGSEWEFAASIRNLFDTEAYDYSSRSLWYNLPLRGREVWAELRYKY